MANFEVLDAQVGKYEDLPKEIAGLSDYSFHNRFADLAGFIAFDDEEKEIFTFGKYKGQRVKEVFQKDLGYFGWIQNADFPLFTKKVLTGIQLRSKF